MGQFARLQTETTCVPNQTFSQLSHIFVYALLDCTSVYNSGSKTNGVYMIYVAKPGISINVFCDMTAHHVGWIVIQRRVDSSTDFYRDWQAYKDGFGNMAGNM